MAEPHQQVVVDQGSTKATVHTADGRITQVSVNPDGTIVRNRPAPSPRRMGDRRGNALASKSLRFERGPRP